MSLPAFDSEEMQEYRNLQAFVDSVHVVVKATAADLARTNNSTKAPPKYSDKTLEALGELARRAKAVSNLLDRLSKNGQSYN